MYYFYFQNKYQSWNAKSKQEKSHQRTLTRKLKQIKYLYKLFTYEINIKYMIKT